MVFKKFVEIGRVAMINYGEDEGKLCVIVDVIDNNRVLVDGPTTGVSRQAINLLRIKLTDFKIECTRGARAKLLKTNLAKEDIVSKFAKTSAAKKVAAKKARASASDFDRFKLMIARQKRSTLVNQHISKLRKATAKKA